MRVAALCVAASLLAAFLRRGTPELALVLALTAAAVAALTLLDGARGLLTAMDGLLESAGLDQRIFAPLVRIVGISVVSRVSGELCKDAGQGGLAVTVELAGTVCALSAASPLLEMAARLLGRWLG